MKAEEYLIERRLYDDNKSAMVHIDQDGLAALLDAYHQEQLDKLQEQLKFSSTVQMTVPLTEDEKEAFRKELEKHSGGTHGKDKQEEAQEMPQLHAWRRSIQSQQQNSSSLRTPKVQS
jgi:hypothetical protein